jgi:hypothetical protein
VSAEALQKWLWQCVAAGWDPTGGVDSHWSHDDNMAVQHLGWMIAMPPGSEHFDLFSLRPGVRASSVMKTIIDAASVDPLCAKAVALLGKQRVLHPNTKFAFVDEGSKK